MARYSGTNSVLRAVREQQVIAILMEDLRNAYGAQRLGSEVRNRIHFGLERDGLAYFPVPLPWYQHEVVVIYEEEGPVTGLISEAIGDSHISDVEMNSFISQLIRVASQARMKLNQIQDVLVDEDGSSAANPGDED